jgi:hypothetical protein
MSRPWPVVLLSLIACSHRLGAQSAVFEDFSQGVRLNGSGSLLWDVYLDDCDTPQSASAANDLWTVVGDNTYGAWDRGCGAGHGNALYWHFFPYPYLPPNGHAANWLISGSWNVNYNRMRFRMMCTPHNVYYETNPSLSQQIGDSTLSIGTYVKPETDMISGNQGDHFYHGLGFNIYAGQWSWFELNRAPNHWRDDPGYQEYPEDPTWYMDSARRSHYFDGLTRFYFDSASNNVQSTFEPVAPLFRTPPTMDSWSGLTCQYTDFTFRLEPAQPDAFVETLNGTYNGTGYEVSLNTVKNHVVNYTVNYSTSQDIKTLGFSNASSGGTIASNGTPFLSATWKSPPMAQVPRLWVAFRPQMPVSQIAQNPMEVFLVRDSLLATGDTVAISGVQGCTAANGTWPVTVLPQQSFTVADGQLVNIVTDASGNSVATTSSPHGLHAGRLVEMYQTDVAYTFNPTPITAVTSLTFGFNGGLSAGTIDNTYQYWNMLFIYALSALQLQGANGCNASYSGGGTVVATSETKNFTELEIDRVGPSIIRRRRP